MQMKNLFSNYKKKMKFFNLILIVICAAFILNESTFGKPMNNSKNQKNSKHHNLVKETFMYKYKLRRNNSTVLLKHNIKSSYFYSMLGRFGKKRSNT